MKERAFEVAVVGAGPAGVVAALRSARLGASTALVTRDAVGGMAANDGPVPVRTLAQAARLMREARQLPSYGVTVGELRLDYPRLLARVREVSGEVRAHSILRADLEQAGVVIFEHAGTARFADDHLIASETAPPLRAGTVILCTGGASRRLDVAGSELTSTHSDAWTLTSTPPSMLVIGAGATGVQVASIFNAFGTRVHLFEAAPRLLMTEDEDVAATVTDALRATGITVTEGGSIERFEPTPTGVRLVTDSDAPSTRIEAALVIVAIGWAADTTGLNLSAAGVETDDRGYIRVDQHLRTTAQHVFAAGDVTGHAMVVHEAVREGFAAATNAAGGRMARLPAEASPIGSFTDPEYASVGLTETAARAAHTSVVVVTVPFETLPRPLIDGRPVGFCKLIVDRHHHTILGCHIVGERAVELAQLAATAMGANISVSQLATIPFSFPTYANALGRAAIIAARELGDADGIDTMDEHLTRSSSWRAG